MANITPAHITMSSRDIADLVNLRHDNVKRTIEMLAERGTIKLPQIEEVSTGQRGPKSEVYLFDHTNKRDSYVVVAQLSPEFTARLVDRWQELESQVAQPSAVPGNRPPNRLSEVRGTMREMLGLARLCGLKGNQAILSANRATESSTGVAPLALLGITHLDADQQEILLTTTEAGESLGLARNKTYPHLAALGLVTGYRDHKDRQCWELTDMGKQVGGIYQDTGKKHGDGVPVRQIRWTKSAVEWIKGKSVVGGTEGVQ